MFRYYEPLRRRHDMPVLPIGVYLLAGLDGIAWDPYVERLSGEHALVRFNYAFIGFLHPTVPGYRIKRLDAPCGSAKLLDSNVFGVGET